MYLYMHRGHVWKMRAAQTACMIILLEGLAAATPTINIPLNSQFPPVARVSTPFNFTFSESTFSSDEKFTYDLSKAPSWLSLDSATRTLSGTPPDWASGTEAVFDIVATDGSGYALMKSTLIVSPYSAPKVAMPIQAQLQSLGESTAHDSIILNPSSQFSFSFSENTFTYNESPSLLGTFALTMDNTPLPRWISFNNATMTFSGETPDSKDLTKPQERFGIRLIASERPGFAGASIPFYIVVESHKLEWDDKALQMKSFVGKPFEFKALSRTLKLDGKVANKSDIISIAITEAPSWLEFDNTTYVLYGIPQESRESASPRDVTVSAQDRYGGTAEVVIRVTLANKMFSDGDIGPVDAGIGQFFSYNISHAFVDPSAVNVRISVSPADSGVLFDSNTLSVLADIPKGAEEKSINITMLAKPKVALPRATPDLKSFTINVVSHPRTASSDVHTSGVVETGDSTLDSNGLEATTVPSSGTSRHGLSRGELAAVVILSIFAVALIAGLLFYCGRRQRSRFKLPDPIVPLSKRNISKPSLQKKFSLLGLNGSPGGIHPGLRAKAKNANKITFDNPDPFSPKIPGATVRPSTSSSKYSDPLSSNSNAGNRGHKDFSRPFQGTGGSVNSIDNDPDIIIIQNFPSEPDETKSHGITAAPSAGRTKGGTYSLHPYRTAPRSSDLQQTPEASCTTKTKSYRAHRRHRTPSNLGPLPSTPSKTYSGTGLQHIDTILSERNINKTVQPWAVHGHNQNSSVRLIEGGTWENTPGSPIKSSAARPRSSLSVVTESTDVLYLGQSSPTAATEDAPSSSKPSSNVPFTQPLQTFLDMVCSPPSTNTGKSSPSPSRRPSRRSTGSSPFVSGTQPKISRVQSRSKKLFGESKEVAAKNSRRQAVPEPFALRKLAREDNSLQALQDPGLANLLDGLGSSRIDPAAMSSYNGSIEMTEDGTKRLISFLATVDKRKSWVSDTESRQPFSAWDVEQENEGASEVSTGVLKRLKSFKSTVSSRSKTTFRGQSIWLGNEGKNAREETFVEQMATLEYCGGPFKGGDLWPRSHWSESNGDSIERLSTPLSPKSFELSPWAKKDGNDGVRSAVV
ncbi:hypothetical protein V496_06650 [Pseudogymnoascus sp. VKM F-4515 (FW-2607)]|nr:hypothetical protein V496_06650 [Pseudogymnoascus sp. VKM F-4515 (FW-2607)]